MALRDRREQAIQRLSDSFVADRLPVEEFEDRLARVHAAATVVQVDAVVADLAPLPAGTTSTALAPLTVNTGASTRAGATCPVAAACLQVRPSASTPAGACAQLLPRPSKCYACFHADRATSSGGAAWNQASPLLHADGCPLLRC